MAVSCSRFMTSLGFERKMCAVSAVVLRRERNIYAALLVSCRSRRRRTCFRVNSQNSGAAPARSCGEPELRQAARRVGRLEKAKPRACFVSLSASVPDESMADACSDKRERFDLIGEEVALTRARLARWAPPRALSETLGVSC